MITVRKQNGDVIILGTLQENLIIKLLDWGEKSRFSPLNETEQETAKQTLVFIKEGK